MLSAEVFPAHGTHLRRRFSRSCSGGRWFTRQPLPSRMLAMEKEHLQRLAPDPPKPSSRVRCLEPMRDYTEPLGSRWLRHSHKLNYFAADFNLVTSWGVRRRNFPGCTSSSNGP